MTAPPHNLDAEASLLGAMLLSSDAIESAVQVVTVDDFYKPAHAHVFDAITSLHAEGEPADPITVAEELKRANLLESVGGAGALIDLESQTPASANAAYYAQIIQELAMMRKFIGVGGEVAQLGWDQPDDLPAALACARELIDKLAAPSRFDADDLFIDWPTLWARERTTEWLFEPVLALGRGHSIYGARKLGKSLLLMWIAKELAAREDTVVLFFDYEMGPDDLLERLEDFGVGPDADLSRMRWCSIPDLPSLDTAAGGARFEGIVDAEMARFPGCRILVVIDTYGRAVEGDENDADTTRRFFRHTGTRLKRLGVTWVRTDHTGKDASKGARGSSAKADDVDLEWQLAATDGGLELRRKNSRMNWVPEKVTFHREDGPPLRFVPVSQDYPAGTRETADLLDGLGVPATAKSSEALAALRASDNGRRREVVLAAQRYRQEQL